jgi:hypothetical protein
VDLVAEMAVYNPFDFFLEPRRDLPFAYDARSPSWRPTWWPSPLTPLPGRLPGRIRRERATIDFLVG